MGMYAGVHDGIGRAVLPCYLAEDDDADALVRIGQAVAALAVDLWRLIHADLRYSARVRAPLDCVATAVEQHSATLVA